MAYYWRPPLCEENKLSENCTSCGQELPQFYDLSNTALIGKALKEYAAGNNTFRAWEALHSLEVGDSLQIDRIGLVEKVHRVAGEYDAPEYTQHIEMVLKITQYLPSGRVVKFFKKTGEYSSFDGNEWNGPFKETSEKPVTILVWE